MKDSDSSSPKEKPSKSRNSCANWTSPWHPQLNYNIRSGQLPVSPANHCSGGSTTIGRTSFAISFARLVYDLIIDSKRRFHRPMTRVELIPAVHTVSSVHHSFYLPVKAIAFPGGTGQGVARRLKPEVRGRRIGVPLLD